MYKRQGQAPGTVPHQDVAAQVSAPPPVVMALSLIHIFIVDFAVLELRQGTDLLTATLDAAIIRLRPILMTSIAFIMGCLPLAVATGAGAAARQVVGVGVIGAKNVISRKSI